MKFAETGGDSVFYSRDRPKNCIARQIEICNNGPLQTINSQKHTFNIYIALSNECTCCVNMHMAKKKVKIRNNLGGLQIIYIINQKTRTYMT
jgi:hypothetical protein